VDLGPPHKRKENAMRSPPVSSLPKGTAFVRMAIALAVAEGNYTKARDLAAEQWGGLPAKLLQKATIAGAMTSEGWADELTSDRSANFSRGGRDETFSPSEPEPRV
jgi:hypothetical protein